MIRFLVILTLIISFSTRGQNIDSLGVTKNSQLNKYESAYLNEVFAKKRGDFDFTNKRIVYFVGSNNYKPWNKKDYFESVKNTIRDGTTMQHQLLILSKKEKVNSGGFDAIIVAWSKITIMKGDKKKLINNIKKSDNH